MFEKFSGADRAAVVQELAKLQNCALQQVGRSAKFLCDDQNRFYAIFGAREDWHGISGELMVHIEAERERTLLVVAKKFQTRIDICVAHADLLCENKNALPTTRVGGFQFHTALTEDGMFVEEIPALQLKKIGEVPFEDKTAPPYDFHALSKILNLEIVPDATLSNDEEMTHSDWQAKIILIGKLLGYRTYTPDKGKMSRYGLLGELCSEKTVPDEAMAKRLIDTVRNIDVIWFDVEGWPTHCFEVEHTTDITKGLLRLYQTHKLRVKMFIVAHEDSRTKFDTETRKSPFFKIRETFIFRTYSELSELFESVKNFARLRDDFLENAP